jgi:pimeloyl-ACP methyl ester carboxylesterase
MLVLMDTSPGPVPGMDGELIELGAALAVDEGMDELKRVMDAFSPLGTPAYERVLAERPGYREFQDRKWAALSPVMWSTIIREIRDQPDELSRLATVTCPTLVVVGEEDTPFVGVSRTTAETIPGAELAIIPAAGHSPQFENSAAWLEALSGFLDWADRRDEHPAA